MSNYCRVNSCSYETGIIDTSHFVFRRFKCIENNFCLRKEIKEVENTLGSKSDSETNQWEARVEQSLPPRISIDNCIIM